MKRGKGKSGAGEQAEGLKRERGQWASLEQCELRDLAKKLSNVQVSMVSGTRLS